MFKFISIAEARIKPDVAKYYDRTGVIYDYKRVNLKCFLNRDLNWHERFSEVLPFSGKEKIFNLGESNTPLIPSKKYQNCFFKDEGKNPSGSFKDRESAVAFPYLLSQNRRKFLIASSGNAAVSASLFGNVYNCEVLCFIPKKTSKTKTDLIHLFGGNVQTLDGYFEEVYRHVANLDLEHGVYNGYVNITPGIISIRDQGNKIIAFEIFDQLGEVPDYVVVPCANGSLLYGMYQGFKELQILGLAKTVPVLIPVQIENASPLVNAIKEKKEIAILSSIPESKAEGIVAQESYCSIKAIKAIKESKGFVLTVNEKELEKGLLYAIKEEGILPEWTSASVFSAVSKLYLKKKIALSAKLVVVNSGSGMKEISNIAEFFST